MESVLAKKVQWWTTPCYLRMFGGFRVFWWYVRLAHAEWWKALCLISGDVGDSSLVLRPMYL